MAGWKKKLRYPSESPWFPEYYIGWIEICNCGQKTSNKDGAKEDTKEGTEEGTKEGTEEDTDSEYDEYKENDYEGEGYDYSLDHLPQDDFQVESERTTQEKFPKSSSKVPSR